MFNRNLAGDMQDMHNDKFQDKDLKSKTEIIANRNRILFNPDQDRGVVKKMIFGLLVLIVITAILLIWVV